MNLDIAELHDLKSSIPGGKLKSSGPIAVAEMGPRIGSGSRTLLIVAKKGELPAVVGKHNNNNNHPLLPLIKDRNASNSIIRPLTARAGRVKVEKSGGVQQSEARPKTGNKPEGRMVRRVPSVANVSPGCKSGLPRPKSAHHRHRSAPTPVPDDSPPVEEARNTTPVGPTSTPVPRAETPAPTCTALANTSATLMRASPPNRSVVPTGPLRASHDIMSHTVAELHGQGYSASNAQRVRKPLCYKTIRTAIVPKGSPEDRLLSERQKAAMSQNSSLGAQREGKQSPSPVSSNCSAPLPRTPRGSVEKSGLGELLPRKELPPGMFVPTPPRHELAPLRRPLLRRPLVNIPEGSDSCLKLLQQQKLKKNILEPVNTGGRECIPGMRENEPLVPDDASVAESRVDAHLHGYPILQQMAKQHLTGGRKKSSQASDALKEEENNSRSQRDDRESTAGGGGGVARAKDRCRSTLASTQLSGPAFKRTSSASYINTSVRSSSVEPRHMASGDSDARVMMTLATDGPASNLDKGMRSTSVEPLSLAAGGFSDTRVMMNLTPVGPASNLDKGSQGANGRPTKRGNEAHIGLDLDLRQGPWDAWRDQQSRARDRSTEIQLVGEQSSSGGCSSDDDEEDSGYENEQEDGDDDEDVVSIVCKVAEPAPTTVSSPPGASGTQDEPFPEHMNAPVDRRSRILNWLVECVGDTNDQYTATAPT